MRQDNLFIMAWCSEGLEAVVNITNIEKEATWAMLKDQEPPKKIGHIVNYLMLRARANGQRHYEIYTMLAVDGISEEDIRSMFDSDPQGSAELIRDRGNKIYSDRRDATAEKIV